MTAIAIQHRDEIIAKVASGEMLNKVASDLDIVPSNISKHLADDPEYKKAREIGAELRLHLAYSRIEDIADLGVSESGEIVGLTQEQGNLARVRESALRGAQWFAEREFPDRWGGKPTVVINQGVSVDGILDELTAGLVDRMRTVAEVPKAGTTSSPATRMDAESSNE